LKADWISVGASVKRTLRIWAWSTQMNKRVWYFGVLLLFFLWKKVMRRETVR